MRYDIIEDLQSAASTMNRFRSSYLNSIWKCNCFYFFRCCGSCAL